MAQLLGSRSDAEHIHSKKKVVQNGGALHRLRLYHNIVVNYNDKRTRWNGADELLFYLCAGRAQTAVMRFAGCYYVFYNLAELQKLCYINLAIALMRGRGKRPGIHHNGDIANDNNKDSSTRH